MTEKLLLTAAESAALLSMGKSTFWREVAKGTLPEAKAKLAAVKG